jgi:hypothetical protein
MSTTVITSIVVELYAEPEPEPAAVPITPHRQVMGQTVPPEAGQSPRADPGKVRRTSSTPFPMVRVLGGHRGH